MKLYFVRHGKTEYNLAGIIQGGNVDSPLLEEGIVGAKAAGHFLRGTEFQSVIVSPQKRAQDTAKYLIEANGSNNYQWYTDERLKEMDFGTWDGKSIKSFQSDDPKRYKMYTDAPAYYDPRSFRGENYQELINRGKEAVQSTLSQNTEGNILFVAHSVLITAVVKNLIGFSLNKVRADGLLDNCSITSVECKNENNFQLIKWNDTSFLEN